METIAAEWYMVIPIDVPFVEQRVFARLIKNIDNEIDAIVPIVNGKEQPLLSIYHRSMKKWISTQLDVGKRSVQEMLNNKIVVYVPMKDEKPFTNINWLKDYQKLIRTND